MRRIDYLVVGAGLTGATIARMLTDAGRDVIVVDRRFRVAGNVADNLHPSGIRYCQAGPHYFRTSSEKLWEFATRFAEFYKYEAEVLTRIDDEVVSWPLTEEYIHRKVGAGWRPDFTGFATNFEEQSLSMMPRLVYEKAVRPYTELMWGVRASTLSTGLARRFDVRSTTERRLTPNAKYQGLPIAGYSAWVGAMLNGIEIRLAHDHLKNRGEFEVVRKLIFTGPIDEYYDFDLGKLLYRGQRREHIYLADQQFAQEGAQVNNPTGPHIRSIEWKRIMRPCDANTVSGTLITKEFPQAATSPNDYEYPFPDATAAGLYSQYKKRVAANDKLVMAGRLGTYRYLDMDASIGAAMKTAEDLLLD